jgi:hypothetical protein
MNKTLCTLAIGIAVAGNAHADNGLRFDARLEGGDAAGRVIETDAKGKAKFEVIDGGTALHYEVKVQKIFNVFMAHIHIAAEPFGNGPIAFWFVPTTPPMAPDSNLEEESKGVLAAGVIMNDNQLVGPLAPNPENPEGTGIQGLINAILDNRAYVVVHTSDLDNTNNVVPGVAGDSPPGELRGQIE